MTCLKQVVLMAPSATPINAEKRLLPGEKEVAELASKYGEDVRVDDVSHPAILDHTQVQQEWAQLKEELPIKALVRRKSRTQT